MLSEAKGEVTSSFSNTHIVLEGLCWCFKYADSGVQPWLSEVRSKTSRSISQCRSTQLQD
jgi:hypothetical protein